MSGDLLISIELSGNLFFSSFASSGFAAIWPQQKADVGLFGSQMGRESSKKYLIFFFAWPI